MKRRWRQPDSLELLLDTVCCAFGGIILIALLVALLARDTANDAASGTPQDAQRQIAAAEQLLDGLTRAHAELEKKTSDSTYAERMRLAAERASLRRELEEKWSDASAERLRTSSSLPAALFKEARTLQEQMDRQNEKIAELEGTNAAIESMIADSQTLLTNLTAATGRQRSDQVAQLRPPVESNTTNQPVDVIIRYGRIYPVEFFQGGQRTPNRTTLSWRGPTVTPRRGVGIDPERDATALINYLNSVSPGRFYFVFHVYEDSFAEFNLAKQACIRHGHRYTWVPLKENTVLTQGGGGAPRPLN